MSSVYWIFFFQVLAIYFAKMYLALLMLLLTHGKYTEVLEGLERELNPTFKQGHLLNEFTNIRLLKFGVSLLFRRTTTDLFRFDGVTLRRD